MDELLKTCKPAKFRQFDQATGLTVERFMFAHEYSYHEDDEAPACHLPGAIFDLLPGVAPGPRHPSGLLAVNPEYVRDLPVQGSYTVDFGTEEAAMAALAEAVRKHKEINAIAPGKVEEIQPPHTYDLPSRFFDVYDDQD